MSSFRETKHPSSKTAQIQSQTNHFEEVSIHDSSLISPQSFSCCQEDFQLLSSSLTALPSFWGDFSLHFPATFTCCPPGAQGKPISLSILNRWLQAKSPTASVSWTMPAPCPAEACWPLLLTSNCAGINFSNKHQYRVHLETPNLCKKQLPCYLLSSPSPVLLWPLW